MKYRVYEEYIYSRVVTVEDAEDRVDAAAQAKATPQSEIPIEYSHLVNVRVQSANEV